jgi:glutamine amidotransferase
MCLLINQEKGSVISDQNLRRAYDSNDDGAGYCFSKDGKIQVKKYRSFKKFLKAYKSDVKSYGKTSGFIVHFRITTHGTTEGTFNVHPFKVNKNLYFAHNGVIGNVRNDEKYSDTQIFNFEYLQKLPEGFIKNKAIQELISKYIGHSKLVFLNERGESTIINENLGHWDGGIWYSNSSYQEEYGYYGGYNYGYSNYGSVVRTPIVKTSSLAIKQLGSEFASCEWCGEDCQKTTKVDVSAQWNSTSDNPNYVEMCDTCLNYQDVDVKEPLHEISNV